MNIVSAVKSKLGGNSLHSNSIFLIAAQGLMTVFGYVFWVFAAHLYNSTEVGLAGTLISIATLISQISILGLNNALVRFLPKSTQKNEKINTSLILVVIASLAIAIGYALLMPIFSPKMLFVRHDTVFLGLFLLSMVLVTINTFTDSVFLANRATKYNVAIYAGYSIVRLILPFAFVGFGARGIFMAHISGVIAAVVLSFYYMVKKFNYKFSFRLNKSIMKLMGGYSIANYIAGFVWGFPLLIAPILIVNRLGAQSAAYFYMVMMIINMLQIIPTSTTQSLFAEGSHAERKYLISLVLKSLKFTMGLTVAGVIGVLLLGKFAIEIFGHEYAAGGANLLYLLASATVLMVLNMTGNVILKVQKRLWMLVGVNAFGAAATLASFAVFLHMGLIGIGIGYIVGQTLSCLAYAVLFAPALLRRHRGKFNAAAALSE